MVSLKEEIKLLEDQVKECRKECKLKGVNTEKERRRVRFSQSRLRSLKVSLTEHHHAYAIIRGKYRDSPTRINTRNEFDWSAIHAIILRYVAIQPGPNTILNNHKRKKLNSFYLNITNELFK